jgi:uncharacterized protein
VTTAVLDVNVLVYMIDADAGAHEASRAWWLRARSEAWMFVVPDPVIVGCLRVLGLPSYGGAAGTTAGAAWIDRFLARTGVRRATASDGAYAWFRALVDDLALSGNDVPDAYLAAIALDLGATLVTTDRGFSRYPGLLTLDPTATAR